VALLALGLFAGCSSERHETRSDSGSPPGRDASQDASQDASNTHSPRDLALRVSAPEALGFLAGHGARVDPPELELYGTDLGWSLVHDGKLFLLFGDSMPYAKFYCDEHMPLYDDIVGRLPLEPSEKLPRLHVEGDPENPSALRYLELHARGSALDSGIDKTPLAAFSDGEHAFAFFGQVASTRCDGDSQDVTARACPDGLTCAEGLGECAPAFDGVARPCDLASSAGCRFGQTCGPSTSSFCIDTKRSQYDGRAASTPFAVASDSHLAIARYAELTIWVCVALLHSKMLHYPSARTV
jgi:hypothetical protein